MAITCEEHSIGPRTVIHGKVDSTFADGIELRVLKYRLSGRAWWHSRELFIELGGDEVHQRWLSSIPLMHGAMHKDHKEFLRANVPTETGSKQAEVIDNIVAYRSEFYWH